MEIEPSVLQSPETTQQLIHHIIMEEYLKGRRGYASRAADRLHALGCTHQWNQGKSVPITPQYISSIKLSLFKGERTLTLPTYIKGKVSARHKKDQAYARFWTLVDLTIPKKEDRRYCGLAASQLGMIRQQCGGEKVVVVERDPGMADWIEKLCTGFLDHLGAPFIEQIDGDIWEYLSTTTSEFNVLDLDLMCNVQSIDQLASWAFIIHGCSLDSVVVNLTTGIGRKITADRYEALMAAFPALLKAVGFKQITTLRTSYREKVIPMRCEHFILEK